MEAHNPHKICLVVDDDLDDQELFLIAIESCEHQVECVFAENGLEAIAKLERMNESPDYIFLDLNMPKMGGKECLRRIKDHPHWSHIPVIILSTSSEMRDKLETAQLGAVDFITKPPHTTTLGRLLADIFNKYPVHKV